MATLTTPANPTPAQVTSVLASAANGDTIQIPDSTVTWTSGVTVNKRVIIKAQHSTPVAGGRTNQSVVITNGAPSGTALFSLTTGSDYYTGLWGIKFIESALGKHVHADGSGTKPAFLNDCYFDYTERFGTAPNVAAIQWGCIGGLWYNTYFNSLRDTNTYGGITNRISSPRAWASASTMGTADTGGNVNVYVEDCSIIKNTTWIDADTNCRVVVRYNTFNGSNFAHHGLTSNPGARHSEWYNNTFSNTYSLCNIGAYYFWIRGGTAVMTANVVNNASYPSDYGTPTQIKIGEHDDGYGSYPPTSTPAQYMPGWGHNGSSFVSDPIYIWSNTGARANTYNWISSYWQGMTALDRDFFVSAKPGWTAYTYPHNLRSVIESQAGGAASPPVGTPVLSVR